MNKVYESQTTCVHDDRVFITPDRAFEILMSGKSIMVNDPPNYTAEEEYDIFDAPRPVYLNDVLSIETLQNINKLTDSKIKAKVLDWLRGQEITE